MSSKQLPVSIADRVRSIERALTADDLADLLQISRLTILRKAKKGIIPSFRVGTLVRFCPNKIYDWLKQQAA